MKITDRLNNDHLKIRGVVSRLSAAMKNGDQAPEQVALSLLPELTALLRAHVWAEDLFFYPIVRAAIASAGDPDVFMAYMDQLELEHRTVDDHVVALTEALGRGDVKEAAGTLGVMMALLDTHFQKEEKTLFPRLDRSMGAERLEGLDAELSEARSRVSRLEKDVKG